MEKDVDSNANTSRPLWILNDWLRLINTSNLPVDQEEIKKFLNPPLESAEFIKKIFRDRILQVERSNLPSTAVGTPDFLSVSFLPKAVKRSLAICRILQNFSREEFIKLIEYAQGLNESQNFDTPQKVQEIFSIPPQYATEIFGNDSEQNSKPLERLKSYIADAHNNELAESRLAKLNPFAIGTGFLVGGNHLLTNQHVLPTQEVARRCIAQFNYAEGEEGNILVPIEYEFDPKALFVSNKDLDYTLIELRNDIFKKQAGYEFGWIELVEFYGGIAPGLSERSLTELGDSEGSLNDFLNASPIDLEALGYDDKDKSIPGDPVIIVQHPRGRRKQVVVTNNRVTNNGLYKNFLRYTADSLPGASGSPVFNTQWQLIGLNHASIPDSNGNIIAEQGIRTCRIVEDLKKQYLHYLYLDFFNSQDSYRRIYSKRIVDNLYTFIENFVVTAEKLNHLQIPSSLLFDGQDGHIDLSNWMVTDEEVSTSINSNLIIFASADSIGQVQLWSSRHEQPVKRFQAHNGSVLCLNFSPNDSSLASGGTDGEVKIWNLESLDSLESEVKSFNNGENGNLVEVRCIRFSPDGQMLASGGNDGKVRLWNLETSECRMFKHGDSGDIHSLCFSFDSQWLASGCRNGQIKIWSTINKQPAKDSLIKSFKCNGLIPTLSFSADGKALMSARKRIELRLPSEVRHTEPYPCNIYTAQVWNLADDLDSLTEPSVEIELAFAAAGNDDAGADVHSVCFSPMGQYITVNWNYGDIDIVNWRSPDEKWNQQGHDDGIVGLGFLIDSQVLASADKEGLIEFTNVYEHIPMRRFYFDDFPKSIPLTTVEFKENLSLNDLDITDPYSFKEGEPFSIEVWVNPSIDGEGGTILSKSNFYRNEYNLQVNCFEKKDENFEHSKVFQIQFERLNFIVKSISTENSLLKPDCFNHVVVICDASEVKLYVNGVQLKSQQQKKNLQRESQNKDYFLPTTLGAYSMQLGAFNTYCSRFKGRIAEVRLWSTKISHADINNRRFSRLTGSEKSLVGYWRCEEGGDLPLLNSALISRKYDEYLNSKYSYKPGIQYLSANNFPSLPFPIGLHFEKENFVECNNVAWSSGDTSGQITSVTVEAWVKHLFGNVEIVSQSRMNKDSGYTISWVGNKIRVTLQDIVSPNSQAQKSRSTIGIFETANYAPTDHVWHHIAFTWSQKTAEVEIYIDGIRQNSFPIQGESEAVVVGDQYKSVGKFSSALFTEAFEASDPNKKPTLYIGRSSDMNTNFQCCISEVRIWKKARTQEQIRKNMYRRLESLLLSESKDFGNEDLVAYWRLDDGGKTNTRVRNLLSDESYGELQGQAKWFPEPSEIIE
ncbi:LamG-like jellyroll fold domain-containing protein [Pantanalinema rosaneae CENA516]|uniref:LamG-like jellyroll fold domain-containing protein n=1 Tax=Pantanalinema rosaneae TaxID=1620701 RepID=UPI003D6F8569